MSEPTTICQQQRTCDNRVTVLITAISAAIRGVGIFALVLGWVTWLGGAQRMSAPSYIVAVQLAQRVGISPEILWGASLMLAGVLVLAHPRTRVYGLVLVAAWCLIFALSLLAAAVARPTAGLTGPIIYTFVAVMVTGLAGVKRSGLLGREAR